MDEALLTRARSGDDEAFRALVERYRRELQLHCYRILGSLADAEDALQETMLAAWRGLSGFEGRASWRAWLYRIATNQCLNILRTAGRRPRTAPMAPFAPPEPSGWDDLPWLEPYPDVYLDQLSDEATGPEGRYQATETVELAFIAALQRVPPRQAATLILRDVLGFGTAEVADMLGTTDIAVKGALARARSAVRSHPRPITTAAAMKPGIGRRFAEAFAADDIDAVVALLTDDAWLTMPPAPHRYHGRTAIAAFLGASRDERRGRRLRLVEAGANRQPGYACYLDGVPAGLVVLTLDGVSIAGITRFFVPGLFVHFGLPGEGNFG